MQQTVHRAAELIQSGNFETAEQLCAEIVQGGLMGDIQAVIQRAVAPVADPKKVVDFHFFVAVKYQQEGHLSEARNAYEKVLEINPNHVHAWSNQATIFRKLGLKKLSRDSLFRAIKLAPELAGLYLNLANVLADMEDAPNALLTYQKAITLLKDGNRVKDVPLYGSVCAGLGRTILVSGGSLSTAIDWLMEALRTNPNNTDTMNVIGTAFCHAGNFVEGAEYFRRILVLKPDDREALNNLGSALGSSDDKHEAYRALQTATKLYPDYADAHANLAMLLLRDGQFEAGFKEYEWRHRQAHALPQHSFNEPQWFGDDIKGKRLLIHAEQGLGDTIHFCRYVRLVAQLGVSIILEVPPELVRLMRCMPESIQIIGQGDTIPAFDVQCPMLSLPLAFQTTATSVPADVPYLYASPDLLEKWRQKIPKTASNLKVGLAWAGNPRSGLYDHAALARRRAIPPESLLPLTAHPSISFFNLQINPGSFAQQLGLIDLMSEVKDFADTAGLMSTLDLIITVDTSVAHLAGAMGKPVWMLDRSDGCWRWLYGADTSPWYPSMRIFRQEKSGDWTTVITRVAKSLERLVETKQPLGIS